MEESTTISCYISTICDITALHILLVILQDMAATHQKNIISKLKRSHLKCASEQLSNPKVKVMYLSTPPNSFVETENLASSSNVEIIDSSFVTLLQKDKFRGSEQRSSLDKSFSVATEEGQDEFELDAEYLVENNNEQIENEDEVQEEGGHDAAICCNDCKEERRRFESLILRKVNQLLEITRSGGVERKVCDYSLLPPMPFKNIHDLQKFDSDLKENEKIRDQFMKKIEEIGGKTIQKTIKFSMEAVMTDELSKKVVWILGPENLPKLNKFTFPYLIIDIARNAFPGTTTKAAEDRIADWLRRGGDRIKAIKVAADKRQKRAE